MVNLTQLFDGSFILVHSTKKVEPAVITGDLMDIVEYLEEKGLTAEQMQAVLDLAYAQPAVNISIDCLTIN